ncbi:MAG: retention module-containing protein, partial [Campylobacter sp.]|nr:retention module-containing protein [Campylobacter sp.]
MSTQIGTVKQVTGRVIAIDANGGERVLNAGDAIFLGEVLKTTTSNSSAVVSMDNGKDISVLGNDTISMDESVARAQSFGSDAVADVSALQQALLRGEDVSQLEETAAGGGAGGGSTGTGSINQMAFEEGGHESRVQEVGIGVLGDGFGGGGYEPRSIGTAQGDEAPVAVSNAPEVVLDSVTPVDTDPKADGIPDKTIVKGHSDEPNAPVVITDKDGKKIGEGTTDDNGNFEVETDPVNPGDDVTATVTDPEGNEGKDTKPAGPVVYEDTTPPVVDLTEVTPVDSSDPADDTPEKTIVKGHSDEPNAPVVITDPDGKELGKGTTDENGDFNLEVDPVAPGTEVTATVTDKAGNEGKDTKPAGPLDYTDETGPKVEIDSAVITELDEQRTNPGDPLPEADVIIIKGHSDEPNAPIAITINDSSIDIPKDVTVDKYQNTGKTDDNGNFEIHIPFDPKNPIEVGDNVKVTVTDKAGNPGSGEKGATDNFTYGRLLELTDNEVNYTIVDNKIVEDTDAGTGKPIDVAEKYKDNKTILINDNSPVLTGMGEPGAQLNITVATQDGERRTLVGNKGEIQEYYKIPESGKWEINLAEHNISLAEGTNYVVVTATDDFANSSPSSRVAVIVDTTLNLKVEEIDGKDPSAIIEDVTPTITIALDDDAEQAILVDKNTGKEIASAYVNNHDGTWDITPSDSIQGLEVKVQAVDKAGNMNEIEVKPNFSEDSTLGADVPKGFRYSYADENFNFVSQADYDDGYKFDANALNLDGEYDLVSLGVKGN